MLPSDAVRHMRAQHDAIRTMMGDVERLLKDPASVQAAPLRQLLERLAKAMREHNRDEEDYIPPFLDDLGRRGVKHTKDLLHQHVAEHDALVGGIEAAVASGINGAKEVWAVLRCIGDLRAHMDHEERTILNEDVLHDVPVTDGTGG